MKIHTIFLDILYLLIFAFIIFLGAEILKSGLISNSFDLHILLIIITIWGLICLIINSSQNLRKK